MGICQIYFGMALYLYVRFILEWPIINGMSDLLYTYMLDLFFLNPNI